MFTAVVDTGFDRPMSSKPSSPCSFGAKVQLPRKTRSGRSSAAARSLSTSKCSRTGTKWHARQYAAKNLQPSAGPRDFAPKCSANSFGFTSWRQVPLAIKRSGTVEGIARRTRPHFFGNAAPKTASVRQRRDSISSCPPKTVGPVQAGLLKRAYRTRVRYFVENSLANGSRLKSTFSLGAIEPRLPLICGSE